MNSPEIEMRLMEINGREREEPSEEDFAAINASEAEPEEYITLDEFKRKTEAPVNPYTDIKEDEILQKLERSREQAEQGLFRDTNEVITDIREKYHL